jgi:hypothetical protein
VIEGAASTCTWPRPGTTTRRSGWTCSSSAPGLPTAQPLRTPTVGPRHRRGVRRDHEHCGRRPRRGAYREFIVSDWHRPGALSRTGTGQERCLGLAPARSAGSPPCRRAVAPRRRPERRPGPVHRSASACGGRHPGRGGRICVTVHRAPGHDLRPDDRPAALLWGLGVGLVATPLTAAVLATVADGDLGEASAIIDAARHATPRQRRCASADRSGRRAGRRRSAVARLPAAMIALAALCVATAHVTGLFVSDDPRGHSADRTAGPAHGLCPAGRRRSGPRGGRSARRVDRRRATASIGHMNPLSASRRIAMTAAGVPLAALTVAAAVAAATHRGPRRRRAAAPRPSGSSPPAASARSSSIRAGAPSTCSARTPAAEASASPPAPPRGRPYARRACRWPVPASARPSSQ